MLTARRKGAGLVPLLALGASVLVGLTLIDSMSPAAAWIVAGALLIYTLLRLWLIRRDR